MIGDQYDRSAPPGRVASERDDIVLIAPDVEYDQHVATSHVEQSVAPNANSRRHMPNVGPDEAKMRREIARERVREAAAEQMHAAFPVAEQPDNRQKICFGKMPERAEKIGDCRLCEWIDQRSLRPRGRAARARLVSGEAN